MWQNQETAAMLGFGTAHPQTPMSFLDEVTEGLSVAALDRVARTLAPDDSGFRYRIVSKTTLARRLKQRDTRLSSEESARLVRLADVWGAALDVWKEAGAARAFLFRPHAMLHGRLPIDVVLQAEVGARIVRDILGGLQYGSAV
ncbi:MAG TPA: antitoxin Xre-like helix-turn-helix domain-containing protein [Aliidongia sp.]|uniref:antitoxin Xre/MbcA/ParS toxin-binding domain-containing protein n=1 Tax=Aliidongia sp. TaxID=1914230 RepID=UPI002DDCB94A|nr:antitoxin Xre-like helix-turn-helix domain-containing protein [Aliidongia sp.]HEV2673980.1 antitoxin Xre-like helix-turn-helix domain-containing protein [Aliidongia sp.]